MNLRRISPPLIACGAYFFSPAAFALSVENAACVPQQQNCTANDANPVLQEVISINGVPYDPDNPILGCTDGDSLDIEVKINYTENSTGGATRYDLASFVGQNGADAIGGGTSNCSVDYLSPVSPPEGSIDLSSGFGPFRNLDGDACGDVRSTDKPTSEILTLYNVGCLDRNGSGTVDISYVVAWQQNTASACDASAIAAGDTSSLLPGTSSKCLYEANNDLGILVEAAPSLTIFKTAAPSSAETNTPITYTVAITNTSDATDPLTITSVTDAVNGGTASSLAGVCLDVGDDSPLSLPLVIDPGETYTCYFSDSYDTAGTYSDTVVVAGEDNEGESVNGQAEASVDISDTPPDPDPAVTVLKSADPLELDEPGGTVTYSVAVQNTGNVDGLSLTALADDEYGNITTSGHDGITSTTCSVSPAPSLDVGETYSCEFTAAIASQPGTIPDTITATWNAPNQSSETQDSNEVIVTINDLPSAIDVTKTASPETVLVPGSDVSFTVIIDNPSVGDSVEITTLVDDQFGSLNGLGDCSVPQTILPEGSYSCSFTKFISLDDGEEHSNLVMASGTDDDGEDVEASGGTTVTGSSIPPASVTPVPTLTQWGLVFLGGILGLIGYSSLRRHT